MRPAPTKLLTLDGDAWGFHSPRKTFEWIIRPRPRLVALPQRSVELHQPQDYANFLGASSNEMECFTNVLLWGDKEALRFFDRVVAMQFIQSGRFGTSFSPYDDVYNTGSGTATTPSGSGNCTVTSDGGGGGGNCRSSQRGGGGGARCVSSRSVSAGDSLGYAVGNGGVGQSLGPGDGNAGGASTTSSGTGGFAGLAHNAGGGGGGTTAAGTGGTATGGTTNTNGSAASVGTGGTAGSGATGGVAAQATNVPPWQTDQFPTPGNAPGGGGGAGFYTTTGGGYNVGAADGAQGRQRFAWAV